VSRFIDKVHRLRIYDSNWRQLKPGIEKANQQVDEISSLTEE